MGDRLEALLGLHAAGLISVAELAARMRPTRPNVVEEVHESSDFDERIVLGAPPSDDDNDGGSEEGEGEGESESEGEGEG